VKHNNSAPVYKTIALDIANQIVKGNIKANEKISGRSTLASMYNVSPETIRRAIALIEEMNVVSSTKGSGIEVISVSNAEKFILKNKDKEYISTLQENIFKIVDKRKNLDTELEENIDKLLDLTSRFRNISPFTLIEIEIKSTCKFIAKSVSQVNFWQRTKVTIVAYRKENEIIVSPGPEYIFTPGDILVVIGSNNTYEKVYDFLYN
jgi:K+/H+ antiporter YhaU regulatory subunit KhtT